MEMKYLSTKEVKRVTGIVKGIIETEPVEWIDYNSFISRLAIEIPTTKGILDNVFETFKDAGYINIREIDGFKAILSVKARERLQREKAEYEAEIKKDIERSPKTAEETKSYIAGLGAA